MNIFHLDDNPEQCAQWYVDKHVLKLILETYGMLALAHASLDQNNTEAPYINHPMTKWVRETAGNYTWTTKLFFRLMEEYTFRYHKVHAYEAHKNIVKLPKNIDMNNLITYPPQCMPTKFLLGSQDYVKAYRDYYREGKKHLHKWTHRDKPEWLY